MATKSKLNSYMGRFKTKAEALKKAKDRKRYGYATRIVSDTVVFEGKKYRGYKLYESQRPTRHTWWSEHLPGESVKDYLARMRRKGIRAYKQ